MCVLCILYRPCRSDLPAETGCSTLADLTASGESEMCCAVLCLSDVVFAQWLLALLRCGVTSTLTLGTAYLLYLRSTVQCLCARARVRPQDRHLRDRLNVMLPSGHSFSHPPLRNTSSLGTYIHTTYVNTTLCKGLGAL